MSLNSASQDFIIKNGAIVLGTNAVTSSTNQNGALQVNGGAAIAQNLIVGTTATIYGPTHLGNTLVVDSTSTVQDLIVDGSFVAAGGITLGGASFSGTTTFQSNVLIQSTQSSLTTITNNALYVAGGVGIQKNLFVGGAALFADTVTFSGTATYVYSTNTYYTENLLELHEPIGGPDTGWTFDDGKDVGLRFHYYANNTNTNAALVLSDQSGLLEWYSSGATGTNALLSASTVYGGAKFGSLRLVTGSPSLASTSTGDLIVTGGVGIGKDLTVGSTVTVYGSIIGTVTTATTASYATTSTNLAGGDVGSLPYQASTGTTTFLPLGANGTILTIISGQIVWSATGATSVGFATTATNIKGGTTGAVPFQAAPGITAFDGTYFNYANSGTTASLLSVWNLAVDSTSTSSLYVVGGSYFANTVTIASNSLANFTGAGALSVTGGGYFGQNIYVANNGNSAVSSPGGASFGKYITDLDSTNASSTGTGALVLTNGGAYINLDAYIGGKVNANTAQVRSLNGFQLVYTDNTGALLNTAVTYSTATTYLTGTITNALFATSSSYANTATNTVNILGGSSGAIPFQTSTSLTTFDPTNLYYSNQTLNTPVLNVANSATIGGNLYVDGVIYIQGVGVDTLTSTTGSFRDVISTGTIYANLVTATTLVVTGPSSVQNITGNIATFTNVTVTSTLTSANIVSTGTIYANAITATTLNVTGTTVLNTLTAGNTTVTNLTVSGIATLGGIQLSAASFTNLTITNQLTVGQLITATNATFTGTVNIANLTATVASVSTLTAVNSTITNLTVTNLTATTGTTVNFTVTNTITVGQQLTASNATFTGTTVAAYVTATTAFVQTFTASSATITGVFLETNSLDAISPSQAGSIFSGGVAINKAVIVGGAITVGTNLAGAGNVVPAIYSNNILLASYTSPLVTGAATVYLDSYSAASYRTARYTCQVVDQTNVHITEITVFHDGTNVYLNEYGTSTNNGTLGTFSAQLFSGNIQLLFTPNNAVGMTIKVVRMGITA